MGMKSNRNGKVMNKIKTKRPKKQKEIEKDIATLRRKVKEMGMHYPFFERIKRLKQPLAKSSFNHPSEENLCQNRARALLAPGPEQ